MNTIDTLAEPVQYFLFGALYLLTLYILLMRRTTESFNIAIDQFNHYKIDIFKRMRT